MVTFYKRFEWLLFDSPVLRTWITKVSRSGRRITREELLKDPSRSAAFKKRWTEALPDRHLTWGREVSGEPFIRKVLEYTKIDATKNLLEIGPGWGRLLGAILDLGLDFRNYYGVDLSIKNVEYLSEKFKGEGFHFIKADIESIQFDTRFDIVISSLTFKHLFPSFEKALSNVGNHLKEGGIIFFDLIEGDISYYEKDETHIRYYTRPQVEDIVKSCGMRVTKFDKVVHAPGYSRLFVVANKA